MDIFRRIVDFLNFDIGRQVAFNLLKFFADIAAYLHRIGPRLLHNDQADTVAAVDFLVERNILDGIADSGDVADIDRAAGRQRHHQQILYLIALEVFAAELELVLLIQHLDLTGRHVDVVGRDNGIDRLQGNAVGVKLVLVNLNIYVTFRLTRHGDVADAVDLVEDGHHLVVEQFAQAGIGLVGGNGVLRNRHGARTELEDDGCRGSVGQVVLDHFNIGPHIVGGFVEVPSPFELQRHNGHVVLGLGGQLFQTVGRVEHIGLDFRGVGTRIGRHHHDVGRIDFRELVDRQRLEGEHTDQNDCHEDQ